MIPRLISSAGEDAVARFVEFFTANIRNKNTRRAYLRNSITFLRWCEKRGIKDLKLVKPVVVAAYVEQLGETLSKPSVKQQLATIRMLFDWLVIGQVVPTNPASSVRGPKHTVKKGKTPVLSAEETRQLLDSIDVSTVVGLRDRAFIAVMVYSFARVGAMLAMKVEDYYTQGRRAWFRLHEKGGKQHEMPAHHNLEAYIDAYVKVGGHREDKKGPLFRTAKGKTGTLSREPDGTAGRLADDPPAGQEGGHPDADRLSQLPGDGDHGLPRERRDAGEGPDDGEPRVAEDDEALRPDEGPDHRRGRADRDLRTRRRSTTGGRIDGATNFINIFI